MEGTFVRMSSTTGATSKSSADGRTRALITGTLWALLRVWVGWEFLSAGLSKIGDPAWTGRFAGVAVRGFLGFAISPQMTGGPHPNVLAPYAWLTRNLFLAHTATLSYLVTAGEVLVGAALILGLATRVALVGGIFLNGVYLLSGSAGLNVPMFGIELAMLLAGTTAGLIGLDTLLLPYLSRRLAHVRVGRGGAAHELRAGRSSG